MLLRASTGRSGRLVPRTSNHTSHIHRAQRPAQRWTAQPLAQARFVPTWYHTSVSANAPRPRPKRKISRDPAIVKPKASNNPTLGLKQEALDKGKNLYRIASGYFGIHPTTIADADEMNLTNKEWRNLGYSSETSQASRFWGVFPDVVGKFKPRINVKITYTTPAGPRIVYRGNYLTPAELQNKPEVRFDCIVKQRYWTLALVDPDAPVVAQPQQRSLVHWLVANIPGPDFGSGETVVDYLPPIPAEKTGMHRYVYVLAQHKDRIDTSKLTKVNNDTLANRASFDLSKFFESHAMKPKGVAFFIADWDKSCTDNYTRLATQPVSLKPPPEPKPDTKRKYSYM